MTCRGAFGRMPGGAQASGQSVPRPGPSLRQGAGPPPGASRRPPGRWPESFFKLLLCFWTGFWMDGPWYGLAPAMPFEQPGDRAFMDLMAHLGFKRALDFARRG